MVRRIRVKESVQRFDNSDDGAVQHVPSSHSLTLQADLPNPEDLQYPGTPISKVHHLHPSLPSQLYHDHPNTSCLSEPLCHSTQGYEPHLTLNTERSSKHITTSQGKTLGPVNVIQTSSAVSAARQSETRFRLPGFHGIRRFSRDLQLLLPVPGLKHCAESQLQD